MQDSFCEPCTDGEEEVELPEPFEPLRTKSDNINANKSYETLAKSHQSFVFAGEEAAIELPNICEYLRESINAQSDGGLMTFSFRLNGAKLKTLLDCGASREYLDKGVAKKHGFITKKLNHPFSVLG